MFPQAFSGGAADGTMIVGKFTTVRFFSPPPYFLFSLLEIYLELAKIQSCLSIYFFFQLWFFFFLSVFICFGFFFCFFLLISSISIWFYLNFISNMILKLLIAVFSILFLIFFPVFFLNIFFHLFFTQFFFPFS